MNETEKPIPPGDYECCESGCDPCVWDIYREKLQAWQEAQKQAATSDDEATKPSE